MIDKYTEFNTDSMKGMSLHDKAVYLGKIATEFAKNLKMNQLVTIPFHVAHGNNKTGDTDSISFVPVATCSEFACMTCGLHDCYDLKSLIYPNVCINRLHNTIWLYAMENAWFARDDFKALDITYRIIESIESQLTKGNSKARWHVGGDIHSIYHLGLMNLLAKRNQGITWYTYTKSYDILTEYESNTTTESNLTIKISDWIGYNVASHYPALCEKHGVAYVDDGTVDYIPLKCFRCQGTGKKADTEHTCASCHYVCSIDKVNVVFEKH